MRIAVLMWGKMGDITFTWPVVAKLKAVYQAEITFFYQSRFKDLSALMNACPAIDHQVLDPEVDWQAHYPEEFKLVPVLEGFDLVYNFAHGQRWNGPDIWKFWGEGKHAMDYTAFLAGLELKEPDERILPVIIEGHSDKVDWREDYVVLACWSFHPDRLWLEGYWDQLVGMLLLPCYALGGPDANEYLPRGAIPLQGKTDTYQYAQIVKDARLMFSIDSFCTALLCEAAGTPLVRIEGEVIRDQMTGPGDRSWPGYRSAPDIGHNVKSRPEQVYRLAEDLLNNYDREKHRRANRYVVH